MNKKTNKIIIFILIIALLINIILVKFNCFYKIDLSFYNLISKLISYNNTIIFKLFSFIVSKEMIIIYLLTILGYCIIKKKSGGLAYFFIIVINIFFNQTLKLIIKRPRPNINPIVYENSYSFPSGHTMTIITIVGLIIYLIWNKTKLRKAKKIIISILLIIISILVMISRIYLGVHYFSDIIGGIISALLLLYIIYYFYNFKYKIPYYYKNKK